MSEQQGARSGKFKDVAREAGYDEDEARWTERLKKVAAAKPDTDLTAPRGG